MAIQRGQMVRPPKSPKVRFMDESSNRAALEKFRKSLADAGVQIESNLIVPNQTISMMAILENTRETYDFVIADEEGKEISPTEKKLAKNDVFYATEASFVLFEQQIGREGSETFATYDDVSVFGNGTINVADLRNVFHGQVDLKVGSTNYFEAFSLLDFYKRPGPQDQGDLGLQTLSKFDFDSTFRPQTPHLKLSSTSKNRISMSIAWNNNLDFNYGREGYRIGVMLSLRGFNAVGAATSLTNLEAFLLSGGN